ncbi:HAD family hydrolase [Aeromicrobium endophyticum]|uniref:Cation-transporting P-type ATPase n=1 Tax=Aeromicrobium endophyticum TaxID=2292704 RepID=A0A371PBG2_9ACTN|nr:HAD family hydrolase [Aeromicrobium endophyticum]REK72810.1 cation-transporting P-type ATPase [Aeromicrobium endophyticum]
MERSTRPSPWWLVGPDLLVGLTVVVSTAWAVASLVDGRSALEAVPAASTVVLTIAAAIVRSRSGLPSRTPVLPPWFVPVVLLGAAAAAVWWGVVDHPADGAGVGVAALVASGPAAAMLAVPLAFRTGASRAARSGVQVTELAVLEATTVVDTLVLAKDGTVTTGDLTVISVDPVEPDHDRNLRWFAGALAKASDQRVDRAVATLSARGRLTDVEVVDGLGVSGSVDRHPVRVGSPHWIGFEAEPTIWTTVGVEVDGRRLGSITVADDVRPDLVRDVGRLRALGLELVLVSADSEARTHHVAQLAGIETVHVTDDAAAVVRELTHAGRRVATAGLTPGHDEALALTTSAGDRPAIVVDDCSPARIADALSLGRGTVGRIRRARTVTAALGIAGLAVAATGLGGPVAAAVVGVCVVVASALVGTSA